MKIAIGCDHGGYLLKQDILIWLEEHDIDFEDVGCFSTESVDYPIYGEKVARLVASGACEKGIVICTTGIGISIAANKVDVYKRQGLSAVRQRADGASRPEPGGGG